MHSTQIFILTQLTDSDGLRYTDMRPATMEASKFMYHLKALIHEGLVAKKDNLYVLTSSGTQFVDKFDEANLMPFSHPRVTISLLYEHAQKGPLLVWRDQQPALGSVGFILQDVPIDYPPPLTEFAKQKFIELTGINTTFSHVGDGYIRLMRNNNLGGNMLTHLMVAKDTILPNSDPNLIWLSDAEPKDILPSAMYVLDLINTSQTHFFFEYEMMLSN